MQESRRRGGLARKSAGSAARSRDLDVVRGVAISAVVLVHSFQASLEIVPVEGMDPGSRIFVMISYLRFGPELFFAISGWLLVSLWERNQSETTGGFWAKRTTRIWPLWVIFTVISFVALAAGWAWAPVTSQDGPLTIPGLILAGVLCAMFLGWLAPNLWNIPAGGWSIQVEMGHYGLFWCMRRWRIVLVLSSVLIGYLTWWLARVGSQALPEPLDALCDAWVRLGLYGTWPFFVAGMLAWRWRYEKWRPSVLEGVVLIGLLAAATQVPVPFGTTVEAALTTGALLLVAMVLTRVPWFAPALSVLGQRSYFVYFAHFWILGAIVGLVLSVWGPLPTSWLWTIYGALFLAATLGSWLVSELSWRWVEGPIIEAGRAFAVRRAAESVVGGE